MAEYPELCQRAIDGWKEAQEKWIPIYCLLGYFYGSLDKKKLKKFRKEIPEVIQIIEEEIEKGRKIVLDKIYAGICRRCKGKINIKAKFCENCGEKI